MKIPFYLSPVLLDSAEERAKLIEFVTEFYVKPARAIPFKESSLLNKSICFYWAIHHETGESIGCTGFIPKTETLVETVKTVIDPKHRGKGYGALLSQAIEEEVIRLGYKKIMSTIYSTNLQMIQIKLKQGYLIEGYHPDHEAPGLHEYSFGKVMDHKTLV